MKKKYYEPNTEVMCITQIMYLQTISNVRVDPTPGPADSKVRTESDEFIEDFNFDY